MRRLTKTITVAFSIVLACLEATAFAGDLYVIIATDDGAPVIGKDMEKNSRMMINLVKRNVPRSRSQIVKLPARSLTPALAMRTIQSLNAGADDAVLFFYSGHGAYDGQRQQTYLTMAQASGTALFVNQIQHAIDAKRVRHATIVLDCCNTLRPLLARGPIAPGESPDEGPSNVSPLFQRLFFEQAGSIVIESSAPGEYAVTVPAMHFRDPRRGVVVYNFGSLFTRSFTGVLSGWEEGDEQLPDWPQICRKTQASIDDEFPELCRGGIITLGNGNKVRQKRQTVTALINGQPVQTR